MSEKKKVLVIDDNGMTLRHIRDLLMEEYDVSIAVSGEIGLKQVEQTKPDIILLDYEMPEMNGKETFEKIRSLKDGEKVPIVFLTSMDDKGTIDDLMALKPAGYLMKPPEANAIKKAIEEALSA